MKTIAPFTNLEELPELIKEGIDELYCGVIEDKWLNEFSESYAPNKRAKKQNSLKNFEELKQAKQVMDENNKILHFIFNNFYVKSQKPFIDEIFENVKNIGVEYYTVTDPYMIKKVKLAGLKPTLSITTPVLNSSSAQFFKDQGVDKIILPRDLSIDELKKILTNVPFKYEVIVFNDTCPNIDGLCRFFHGKNIQDNFVENACIVDFKLKIKTNLEGEKKQELIRKVIKNNKARKYNNSCGVCSLIELNEMGMDYLKIPSRGHSLESKKQSIRFIKNRIDKAKTLSSNNLDEYKTESKQEYKNQLKYDCEDKCYFK